MASRLATFAGPWATFATPLAASTVPWVKPLARRLPTFAFKASLAQALAIAAFASAFIAANTIVCKQLATRASLQPIFATKLSSGQQQAEPQLEL